ncbi:Uncharacterized protein Adt_08819 [Abeliophyllum distichum]|uniref:Uncharacterized protein n=1 Tax=Abeliophyllum distichum TaxID=126358 RepID=A0ABD1UFG6_9LAMI
MLRNYKEMMTRRRGGGILFSIFHETSTFVDWQQNVVIIMYQNCNLKKKIRVVSSHSNPKIQKRHRKSRYGQPVSPYYSEEEDDDDIGGDVDDVGDDEFTDDEFAGIKISKADRQPVKDAEFNRNENKAISNSSDINQRVEAELCEGIIDLRKPKALLRTDSLVYLEELNLDERWFPLLDYLSTFGLRNHTLFRFMEGICHPFG